MKAKNAGVNHGSSKKSHNPSAAITGRNRVNIKGGLSKTDA